MLTKKTAEPRRDAAVNSQEIYYKVNVREEIFICRCVNQVWMHVVFISIVKKSML